MAALLAAVVAPAAAESSASEPDEVVGYVIAVDPGASPAEVAALVDSIANPVGRATNADIDVNVIFEHGLSDGSTGTFGVSAMAIEEEGLQAFDLSTMISDMLSMDKNLLLPENRSKEWLLASSTNSVAVDRERAALAELYESLKGIQSTPVRLIVTTTRDDVATELERVVKSSALFTVGPEPVVAEPGESAAAAGADASCTYFSPKSGNTSLGYSQTYPGKRYTQTYSTWSQARVDHIAEACSVNSTFEIETHTTVTAGHFLGDYYKMYSNLPAAYKDTAFGDGGNAINNIPTKQWAIGTAQLDEVVANFNYRTTMWTQPGTVTYDWFMSNGQLGIQRPPGCTSTWCIFGVDSYFLASPWTTTPGTGSWYKSSM